MVPFKDVLALEEMAPVGDASGLVVAAALEDGDSAELADAEVRAVVVLLLGEASVDNADVEVVGSDGFAPEAGVNSALPDEALAPAPAPEDEPAVFDATADAVPVVEAWM